MEINEIVLGDAYELIKKVPDKSVDLIVTDPPYEIKGLSDGGGVLKGRKNSYVSQMVGSSLHVGIDLSILPEFVRVLKKINIYLWCNKEQIYDYLTFFAKERGCNWEMIVWAKTNPPPFNNGHYLKDKEYCLYFWEPGVELKPSFETGKTVYLSSTNVADKAKYGHPTIKPEEIIGNLIRNSCGGGPWADTRPVLRLGDDLRGGETPGPRLPGLRDRRKIPPHSEGPAGRVRRQGTGKPVRSMKGERK